MDQFPSAIGPGVWIASATLRPSSAMPPYLPLSIRLSPEGDVRHVGAKSWDEAPDPLCRVSGATVTSCRITLPDHRIA
jgi:hypothetical protein